MQIITSSDFDFECYLDFCLVLNVKLNICIKFVLQYRYTTSFAGGMMIDFKLGSKLIMDLQQFCFGLAKMSYLLLMACKDVIFIMFIK